MALCTLTRVGEIRAVPAALHSASIDTHCLDAAIAWFVGQVGWAVESATYTGRYFSGNGSPVLTVPERRITAVSSCVISGASESVLVSGGTDTGQAIWVPETGEYLVHRAGGWPKGYGNVKLTYTAGWATSPEDVQQCIAMMTWVLLEERNRVGMTGKSLGPEQINTLARNSSDYDFIRETIRKYGRHY